MHKKQQQQQQKRFLELTRYGSPSPGVATDSGWAQFITAGWSIYELQPSHHTQMYFHMQLATDTSDELQRNTFCFVFVVFGQQKLCARYSKSTLRTKLSAWTAKAQRMRKSFLIPVYRCGLIWQPRDRRLCSTRLKIRWKEILRYLQHRLHAHSLLLSNTFEEKGLWFLNQAAQ